MTTQPKDIGQFKRPGNNKKKTKGGSPKKTKSGGRRR